MDLIEMHGSDGLYTSGLISLTFSWICDITLVHKWGPVTEVIL